jgi:hypothetical protein
VRFYFFGIFFGGIFGFAGEAAGFAIGLPFLGIM